MASLVMPSAVSNLMNVDPVGGGYAGFVRYAQMAPALAMYSVSGQVGSMLPVLGGWRVARLPVGQASVTSTRCCGFTSRRNAEAKPETSSCEPGNIATRGDLLELLLDRCYHYPLQGTSVILFDVFAGSFVAVSLRVEPRRALSVGPPRGVTRNTQEVCRPPHRREAGGLARPGARPRAALDARILLKATAAGERPPRTGGRIADIRRPVPPPWRERRLF